MTTPNANPTPLPPMARFQDVCAKHPERFARFAPGATAAEIHALQFAVGRPLPEEMLAFHAFRDGTMGQQMVLGYEVLGTSRIVDVKQMWDGLARDYENLPPEDRRARAHWALWDRAWVPVMSRDCEEFALATEPCFGGPAGQIVSFDFKGGGGWAVRHTSYSDWLFTLSALGEEDLFDAHIADGAVEALWRRLNPPTRWIAQEMPSGDAPQDDWKPPPVVVPFIPFKAGDVVKVVGGAFEGKPATFVEVVPDTSRVRLKVSVFGASEVVEVEAREIEVPAC